MIEFTNILNLFDLSTFRPLLRRSKWSNLQNILDFFDLSTFDLWIWGINGKFYQSCWHFSTFRPLVWTSKCSILLSMLIFSTFRSLIGGLNTGFHWIFWFFSTFLPLLRRYKWSNLQIFWIFSTFRLFDLYFGSLNDRIYRIFILNFFDLLIWGINGEFWIC